MANWRGTLRDVLGHMVCTLLIGMACVAQAQTLELREAKAQITVDGQTLQRNVTLPDHWDRQHRGLAGSATFELAFELAQTPVILCPVHTPPGKRLRSLFERRVIAA
jgi:hypothetical protein